LIERLNAGLSGKLTLISAPAGFGKTTLLSEWVHQIDAPAAWLSLDAEDDEPAHFWAYMLAALQRLDVGLAQGAEHLFHATQLEPPSAQAILVPLLNEIAALQEQVVLVLDDYHLITSQAIHNGMVYLLAHQPSQLHLVLSTRADPPLPIVRLRARGQVTELRVDDLRFTPDEVAAFLSGTMGVDLSPADVASLGARTEGWIAGLQLAALALRPLAPQGPADRHAFVSTFSGSHHYVLDYLTQEVLQCLPGAVQQFVIRTSILDRLCGPLCDAVLEDSGGYGLGSGRETLVDLASCNLFLIPLDDQRTWYRYHHLFADLLRKRLGEELPAEEILDLHRRASTWYEGQGQIEEAVKYALRVQDFERVARLADDTARAGTLDGRPTVLLRWAEVLPEPVLCAYPHLCLHQAWALIVNERLDRAQQILQDVQERLRSSPSRQEDAQRDGWAPLLAAVETMAQGLAYGYAGDVVQAAQAGARARQQALALGNLYMAVHATVGLALATFHEGHLRQAAEHYQQLIALAERGLEGKQEAAPSPLAAPGYVGLATVYLEWNDLDAAAHHLDRGLELGRYGAAAHSLVNACIVQSRLRQIQGDTDDAYAALDRAEQIYRARDSLAARLRLGRQRARMDLATGRAKEAAQWIESVRAGYPADLAGRALPGALREALQIVQARVHLAQDETADALAVLEPLVAPAEAAGRRGRVAEISLLHALALQAGGRTTDALVSLARSLSIAEPEGYTRLYLDEGAPAAKLLSALARDPSAPPHLAAYARKLCEAWPDVRLPEPGEADARGESALVEPLTRRELQVLHLIYEGYSNARIAETLVLALNTVKRHASSIYGKLGVHSRTEAVARARQLGLLPGN